MHYLSTRGQAPRASFEQVLFEGLAPDGGLYLPEVWPTIDRKDLRLLADFSYVDLFVDLTWPFVEGALSRDDYHQIMDAALNRCNAGKSIPIRPLGDEGWLLELFHGPTAAFKDFALQGLAGLFDYFLAKRQRSITILGATSGDTGAAAIAACQVSENMRVFILHPHNRVATLQRQQMTTVNEPRVFNIAVKGTFDDCQRIVKDLFADPELGPSLGAVNSINWTRIMAQMTYYFYAALQCSYWDDPGMVFAVPTGNFGNIFSAYVAKSMGLPIKKLIAATNTNDAVVQYMKKGSLNPTIAVPTLSPSMDIQVPSNLERQLFESANRDADRVGAIIHDKVATGYNDGNDPKDDMRRIFRAYAIDDDATLATMRSAYGDYQGLMIDPHTAVAVAAAKLYRRFDPVKVMCLGTAHPAKFPDAVKRAIDEPVDLPPCLQGLADKPERMIVMDNSSAAVRDFIRSNE